MEDYDTDAEGDEIRGEAASRLFGSGNPGSAFAPVIVGKT